MPATAAMSVLGRVRSEEVAGAVTPDVAGTVTPDVGDGECGSFGEDGVGEDTSDTGAPALVEPGMAAADAFDTDADDPD
jgi:hypothetical protein